MKFLTIVNKRFLRKFMHFGRRGGFAGWRQKNYRPILSNALFRVSRLIESILQGFFNGFKFILFY